MKTCSDLFLGDRAQIKVFNQSRDITRYLALCPLPVSGDCGHGVGNNIAVTASVRTTAGEVCFFYFYDAIFQMGKVFEVKDDVLVAFLCNCSGLSHGVTLVVVVIPRGLCSMVNPAILWPAARV